MKWGNYILAGKGSFFYICKAIIFKYSVNSPRIDARQGEFAYLCRYRLFGDHFEIASYLSLITIIQEPFHFIRAFEACSTDAFISVDPYVLPLWVLLDLLTIIADLSCKRFQSFSFINRDSGVCSNPLPISNRNFCLWDFYNLSQGTPPFCHSNIRNRDL